MISIPLFLKFTEIGRDKNLMEKKIKTAPEMFSENGLFADLKAYEKYFEKSLPHRQSLLSFWNYLYAKYIGISPVDRVILGKNRWLFLKRLNESGSEIDYSISVEKFKNGELRYWFRLFNERYRFLKKRGIHLLLVIVPNKSTIYTEHLPERIKRVTAGTRADQITKYFRNHSDIPVLNLRELLLSKKKERRVYHRTDSHWTFFGAWLGYREIIKHFSKYYNGVEAKRFEDFPKKIIKGPSMADLASMLTLQNSLYSEKLERIFFPRGLKPKKIHLKNFKYKKIRKSYFRNNNGVLPKTLMIHDSFGLVMKKYMASTCSEIIFLLDWGFNFFPQLIEREKPSIVIYEIAERFFYRPAKHLPQNRK